ncbi:MAG: hypothetical protein NT077_01450 [Candidatus Taylorbacteria bacterium]|nr:hypothetical protein [Candidatus Taylorbacteria bacterium]
MKLLSIISIVLNLLGSFCFGRGLFISEEQALDLGVSKWGGTREQNLKLPAVKDRLTQRKWGIAGVCFVLCGAVVSVLILFL